MQILAELRGPRVAAAFACGGLLALALAAALGGRMLARDHTPLLLAGVMLAAGFGALIALVLSAAPAERLPGMLFFLMGDLAWTSSASMLWGALLLAVTAALILSSRLDVLQLAPLKAASLGVAVAPTRWMLFVLAGACASLVVAQAGSIGFVGLMVPHALRKLGFAGHRVLLPACALAGGSLLVLADALARTAIEPRELPVGVLTALLGVPVMLWLLRRP